MKAVSIGVARRTFRQLIDDVAASHGSVTITRNGSPTAVLVSSEEWESLQESLHWLSLDDAFAAIADARADLAAGRTISADELRARYHL